MTEIPPWAARAIRAEVGDEPITDFRVLKESPFSRIVIGYTPTRAIVAERGFFGAVAWPVGAAPAAPAAPPMPAPAAESPYAPPAREGPLELEERIEGIGPTYAGKLAGAGVTTVAQLVAADPDALAAQTGIRRGNLAKWQAMGRLQGVEGIGKQYSELLVRAGVASVADLARSTPEDLAAKLQAFQAELEPNVQGNPISPGLVAPWIEAAKAAR